MFNHLNLQPVTHRKTANAESLLSTRTQARGEVKQRIISATEPKLRGIPGIVSFKRNNVNSYSLILASKGKEQVRSLCRRIMAFNDMEIEYSDDLDSSDLISKSNKSLWTMTENQDGTFTLARHFK